MTAAEALRELMQAWDKIMASARDQFPGATDEELYQITASAMDRALGIKVGGAKHEPRSSA